MSKKTRASRGHVAGAARVDAARAPAIDAALWARFEAYNQLDPRRRGDALPELGIETTDPEVLGILTKSHFVIPGKTRHACVQCGECCRYARRVANFTYEACPFLTEANTCAKHERRYQVCHWFPFWVFPHPKLGHLLTIKPYCTGYGQGPLVPYEETLRRMEGLSRSASEDTDGAFVIHELLFLPDRREWVFPSRANVDALLRFIAAEEGPAPARAMPASHVGELHYAHHFTSGLLGGLHEPQATVDERGALTDANEAFVALTARPAATLRGLPLAALFVNPESVAKTLLGCFSRGRVTAVPQRLARPDGTTAPLLLNAMTFRDRADGLVHGALVCVTPVSSVVFNEVTQSQDYARGLIEASLDALSVIDLDGIVTDVNEATVALTGRTRDALVGSRFTEHFADPALARTGVERTLADGQVRNFELDLVDAAGRTVPVSFNATVFRDPDGVPSGIFAAARDIRETRALVEALESARSYARGLIECGLDLMVTIDPEGRVADVNEAAVRMTGRSREALVGTEFRLSFDDPARAATGVEETFRRGELRNYLLHLVTAEGRTIPVSFNATVYRDAAGRAQGVFAIARDISERLAMIRALEEAAAR